jgi:DNA-binding Xre family transcriptional regulator
MNDDKSELFQSFASLPKGPKEYIPSLLKMLEWVGKNKQPRVEDFNLWCRAEFGTSSDKSDHYRRIPQRLSLVTKTGQTLRLTEQGILLISMPTEEVKQYILNVLLPRYIGLNEILSFFAKSKDIVHLTTLAQNLKPKFSQWVSISHYEERVRWLIALDALEQVGGREYQITEIGLKVIGSSADEVIQFVQKTLHSLIDELRNAARDSANSKRLELAVLRAFEFLGFLVIEKGYSNEPDIILEALIGDILRYRVTVDTKASQSGKITSSHIDFAAIASHRKKYKANYAIIVGESFAQGRLIEQAAEHNIALITIDVLCKWLELYDADVLDFDIQRTIFDCQGQVAELPETFQIADQHFLRSVSLINHITAILSAKAPNNPEKIMTSRDVAAILGHVGLDYSEEDVNEAFLFLKYIGIIKSFDSDKTYYLSMSQKMLKAKLSLFVHLFVS